jgi:hypothetical protein
MTVVDEPDGAGDREVDWRQSVGRRLLFNLSVPGYRNRECLYVCGGLVREEGGHHEDCYLPVPPHVWAAFQAGEDVYPILDWLVERYGSEKPWLERAVRRLMGEMGAKP